MSENFVEKLLIYIGADTKDVEKGMKQATASVTSAVNIIKGAIAPLASVFAMDKAFDRFLTHTKSLQDLADVTGESVEALHAWEGAAKSLGLSGDHFLNNIKGLNSAMRSVDFVYSQTAGALRFIGISAFDASGKLKQGSEVFSEIAKKIHGLSDFRAFQIGRLLGLDDLTIRKMQKGGKELDLLIKRQKELGIYSQKDAEASLKFRIAQNEIGRAFEMIGAILVRQFIPALQWLADKMLTVGMFFNRHAQFVKILSGMIAVVFIPRLIALAGSIAGIGQTLLGLGAGFAPIIAMTALFSAAALVVDDLMTYIKGGRTLFEGFWAKFGTGEEVGEKIKGTWEGVKNLFSAIINFDFTELFNIFNRLSDKTDELFIRLMRYTFGEQFVDGCKTFLKAWEETFSLIGISFYKYVIKPIINSIKILFNAIKNYIASPLTALFKFLSKSIASTFPESLLNVPETPEDEDYFYQKEDDRNFLRTRKYFEMFENYPIIAPVPTASTPAALGYSNNNYNNDSRKNVTIEQHNEFNINSSSDPQKISQEIISGQRESFNKIAMAAVGVN